MTGFQNQQLFSEAFLAELRASQTRADHLDACRETIREWRDEYPSVDTPTDLLSYLGRCLSALGLAYRRLRDPDRFLICAHEQDRPLGLCLAVTDEDLDRATKGRHHHARLIGLLRAEKLTWGILTNGRRWRLCYADGPAPYEVYLDAELEALLDRSQLADFALFHRFFSREAFARAAGSEPDAQQGLDRLLAESDKRTLAIERHLKSRVDHLLQSLCLGFVDDEKAPEYDRARLDEIYHNAIYLLYRILFLLYAEARGLLPTGDPRYREISLGEIVEAAQHMREGKRPDDRFSLWKRLTHLFVIVDDGDESLGIRPYNGGLFSDHEKPYLKTHRIADEYLEPALFDLGFIETKKGHQPIDYRDLSVRHLGTLYEGLLEYRLNLVSREPVVVRESKGKRVYVPQSLAGPIKRGETVLEPGQVYFADDKGERKASGSYYTPEDVVQYIVGNTVTPRLEELRASLEPTLEEVRRERAIAPTPETRESLERYADQCTLDLIGERILRLKILDPAMGSGHFLVAAGQVVTNFIVETLNATDWPNDELDCRPLLWKRRVVERCLYGVDLNPLAQELAKLALWISSASVGKPLTFLDHHLKVGNSLYGAPLDRLTSLPIAKPGKDGPLMRLLIQTVVADIVQKLAEVTGQDSDDIAAVKRKAEAFRTAEDSARRLRDIANVWLGSLFGLPIGEKAYEAIRDDIQVSYAPESWELRVEGDEALTLGRKLAEAQRFFHWELEFPEAVIGGACRFDAVLANPPYVGTPPNPVISALYRSAKCGDLYGWLLEKMLSLLNQEAWLGTVVPLSITFSQPFSSLRSMLLNSSARLRLSCHDNIPDNIFNAGKLSENTSTDNMQRTAIVFAHTYPGEKKIETTGLLRWLHEDRPRLFSSMSFADTTAVSSPEVFPKIGDDNLVVFWRRLDSSGQTISRIAKEIYSETRRPRPDEIFITVPRITGYFISATPGFMSRSGVLSVSFNTREHMDLVRVMINSNVFFWYWRSFGDGFHINVDILGTFPVPDSLGAEYISFARRLDEILEQCTTFKLYRGERVPSYNFNRRMDILLEIDDWIVKHVAPDLDLPRDAFAQYKSNSFLRPLELAALADTDDSGDYE